MAKKSNNIALLFDHIAPRYNLLNHVMTGGADYYWRWKLLKEVSSMSPPHAVLDAACGTGDLTLLLHKQLPSIRRLVGVDFSERMLEIARRRLQKTPSEGANIDLLQADCTKLPFDEGTYDLVTCAFGVRNFTDKTAALSEFYRVLKPAGRLMLLELSVPTLPIIREGYRFYTKHALPWLGEHFADNKAAYKYLKNSIEKAPQRQDLTQIMEQAGFEQPLYQDLSLGIVTLYCGEKK